MISVAIDGPSGAGKSSISARIADRFSLIHVDTGAIYRAVGLFFIDRGLEPGDPNAVLPLLSGIEVSLSFENGSQRIFLMGEDVTDKIRTPQVSMAASDVSAIPQVRDFLLEQQRRLARQNNVVMDGRDIGTVVLPDATVKIFLTATPQARAKRRHLELVAKGQNVSYEEVLRDVEQRDHNDSTRAAAPLRQARDAILVDTSELDLEQSVERLADIISSKITS